MSNVPERFVELIASITDAIKDRAIEPGLADYLAARFAPNEAVFTELEALCLQGVQEGWLCAREAGGIKFGRPVKPSPRTHGFSVDVVEMDEIVGPHHRHPNGEIDMVMPLAGEPQFDGVGRGWKAYTAGSAHRPTVRGGKALVLYLLPDGAIEFTKAN